MEQRSEDVRDGGTTPTDTSAATPSPGEGSGTATAQVTVRFWAGARAAAGTDSATAAAPTTVGLLAADLVERHPGLAAVLPVCSVLVDGLASSSPEDVVPTGATVEVLPPFAGG